jgi:hypothetical protein
VTVDDESSGQSPAPAVVCIPSSDPAFRAAVLAVLERHEHLSPRQLETEVARVYPAVSVRRRDLAAEPAETWYAYRDGTFLPHHASTAWTDDDGTAWALIDPATGVILDANLELAALLAADTLVGRLVTEFVAPGTEDVSHHQRRAAQQSGEFRSLGLARRDDGLEILLEYVARVTESGIHAWYREIALARRGRDDPF